MTTPGVATTSLQDQICPSLGTCHLCPLPSLSASHKPISEKLPAPACITETRRTDPAVTSLHCSQVLPSFVMQPNPKAHREAILSCTEGKQILKIFYPWLCPSLLWENWLVRATSQRELPGDTVPLPHLPPSQAVKWHLWHAGKKQQPTNETPPMKVFSLKSSGGARGGSSTWREMCADEVSPLLWTSSQPVINHNILRAL